MKYRNTKTGVVIDVKTQISGGNWQSLEVVGSSGEDVAPEQPKRKVNKKKDE